MPELVACPSCGCKVQVADALLGRRTRCIACGRVFEAVEPVATPAPEPTSYPVHEEEDDNPAPRLQSPAHGPARFRLPLCPRCHRPVSWDALACPHCSHLLDPTEASSPGLHKRRDVEPHRGPMIHTLGNLSMLFGALTLCTGISAVVALATGVPALIMANHDLERIRKHVIDPDGQGETESGRNKAIVGVVLAVVFGLFFVLLLIPLM